MIVPHANATLEASTVQSSQLKYANVPHPPGLTPSIRTSAPEHPNPFMSDGKASIFIVSPVSHGIVRSVSLTCKTVS